MAENLIQLDSVSLESGYVFYSRLQDDNSKNHKSLYTTVRQRMTEAFHEATKLKASTAKLLSQAQNERDKELALLRKQFGVDISLDYKNPQGTLEFIDIFNKYMNIEDIYERNKQIILKTKGKKSVISYFPTYLKQELDATWKDAASSFDFSSEATLNRDVQKWLEDSIPKAIERMFLAKRESLQIDPELQGVYKQLLDTIGDVQTKGSFSQQLANIYKLDEISQAIQEELKQGSNLGNTLKSVSKKCKVDARKGGLSLEAFYDLITDTIQQSTGKGGHAVIGAKGARADNVATFDIDVSPIIEQIEKFENVLTRERAVELFNHIDQSLQTEQGFIVYTSDKNYTLNDGFEERGGFQGGSNIKAIDLSSLLNKAGYNANVFIGAILQLAEGAVGEDMSPEPFEQALAKMIANFLFDDYNAIGAGLTNNVNTLHIMNLNGILLPISSILFALADSINNVIDMSPRSIVDIRINSVPIEFKTKEEQWQWQLGNNATGSDAWNYQKTSAQVNTEISIHFMANLRTMLQNAYFR